MKFHTYEEAKAWTEARKNIECRFEDFRAVMEALGNPQNEIPCVHVAGTNGKGSTCRFLYDILKTRYASVALYTSPHLFDIRDRIRIDDVWISKERYTKYLNETWELAEAHDLSWVAIFTMMFFLLCRDEKPDIAVVEVSLGGRWDTTNVIKSPLLSVITTIDYDHMNFFGNTLAEIAGEKAGIIKPGCPVLLGRIREEALPVLLETSQSRQAPVHECMDWEANEEGFAAEGNTYVFSGSSYQKEDAVIALSAARLLGLDISRTSVKEAVQHSVWPGRFEKIRTNPDVIIDGSHNEEGIHALLKEVPKLRQPVTIVFTALADKRGKAMAKALQEAADTLIVTEFSHSRADTAADLAPDGAIIIPDYKEAVNTALSLSKEGTVLITGSLYFIALIRREFKIIT